MPPGWNEFEFLSTDLPHIVSTSFLFHSLYVGIFEIALQVPPRIKIVRWLFRSEIDRAQTQIRVSSAFFASLPIVLAFLRVLYSLPFEPLERISWLRYSNC